MDAINLFNQWWAHIRFNTYISSISEHEDSEDLHERLSMWRAFGGTVARVALVFRVPYYAGSAEQLNLMFSPVAYMNQDQVHAAIRAIYTPKRAASPLIISSTEVIGGVPQIIFQIPLDESVSPALAELDLVSMFDRLILGPSPYPWVMSEAFEDALAKAGVTDASNRVRISGIPLRA